MVPDESLAYLQYRVIDNTGKEIYLQEESDMSSAQSKNKTRSDRSADEEVPSSDE